MVVAGGRWCTATLSGNASPRRGYSGQSCCLQRPVMDIVAADGSNKNKNDSPGLKMRLLTTSEGLGFFSFSIFPWGYAVCGGIAGFAV